MLKLMKRELIVIIILLFVFTVITSLIILTLLSTTYSVTYAISNQNISTSPKVLTLNLTGQFNLERTNVPFKIIKLTTFNATPYTILVSFQLPENLSHLHHFKYITIVWTGHGTVSYLNNGTKDNSVIFSHGIFKGKFTSNPTIFKGKNVTEIIKYSAEAWITPLPDGWNDPTVILSQSVTFYNALGAELGYVNATGTFNYILGGTVTGINPFGSVALAYNGYYICSKDTKVEGVGSTFGYVIEEAAATICFLITSDWWTAWPGVGIDSLTGQAAFEPPPISNVGWTTGCGCTSIGSIPVPS